MALGLVEAYVFGMGAGLAFLGRRRESRALRAKFAPYTMRDDS
jgi:hypothetical protein